ncbi:hypothetical protein VE03_08512 [Pseudogymnoascus sp. 23342-1-I1]|nr:hypothetical protein VE03_08512 [Pseudogymnoascus sp. 23342-1-I1]
MATRKQPKKQPIAPVVTPRKRGAAQMSGSPESTATPTPRGSVAPARPRAIRPYRSPSMEGSPEEPEFTTAIKGKEPATPKTKGASRAKGKGAATPPSVMDPAMPLARVGGPIVRDAAANVYNASVKEVLGAYQAGLDAHVDALNLSKAYPTFHAFVNRACSLARVYAYGSRSCPS